jgi:tRNA A-37 threonylcarbamoyl transferase component Bud32
MDKLYKNKYLKYKNKYLTLQNQFGGNKELLIQNSSNKELLIQNVENIIKDIENYSIHYKDPIKMNKNVIKLLKKIIQILKTNSTLELATVAKFNEDIYDILKLNDNNYNIYNNIKANIITNLNSLINYKIEVPKLIELENNFIRFIGAGGFGCVFSPPTLITPIIKQEYPKEEQININQYDDNYVVKILSCENNAYKEEFESNMLIKKFDINGNYTPRMIFAGYMNRKDLMDSIKIKKIKKINTELTKLYECLETKLNNNTHEYYGYIITTRVGKSCDNLTTDDINKKNIKQVLTNYSLAIKQFINKLYEKNYIHGDIKTPNITLKDNKIYFIDFGFTIEYTHLLDNDPVIMNRSINFNYPIILHLFSILYFSKDFKFEATKHDYLTLINDIITNLEQYTNFYTIVNTLITSHKYSIFKNIDDIKTYLKKYINYLLNFYLVEEKELYNIYDVYKICFSPIGKNVDIYSLSLVMFHLFYNNIYQDKFILTDLVPDKTLKLISKLFKDALYNNIKNPLDLANRLDNIINTIN